MPEVRRPRLKSFPLRRLFPNMVTIAALCSGLMGIRYGLTEQWQVAVEFLIAAAILDGMDGRIARLLKSTSTFGAQLDSLSDFVCFGVAPPLVMYLWDLRYIKGFGWAIVLFFAVCCALRLARFNTSLGEEPQQPWKKMFFTGVPSPAGAMLCVLPMVMSFHAETAFGGTIFNIVYIGIVGALMASRVPTFSLKGGIRVRHDLVLPVMLGFVLCIVSFISEPWLTFAALAGLYLLHIPVAMYTYRSLSLRERVAH